MSGKPNTQTNFDVTPGQDLGGGLEAFVLSGDPWPMAGTSFLETFPHTLKCRERCPDLDFADNWDESDHAPIRLTTWADFRNAHFSDADPMKEKHTEPCDANGYTFLNGHTFNRAGYDEQNIHYERHLDHFENFEEGPSTIAIQK
ncbi:hypothetical protein EYC84_004636 [Monilinia fructicola]|uniref:Uncharacterized protein n=1 Tax=Monilinia fructicola TaxID=38448 RepID=A0A5M9K465_MONFR|nr:hypothetical protein EYC84_004636 [Monilinia fructicola]